MIDKCLHDPTFISPKQAENDAYWQQQAKERALYPSYFLRADIKKAEEELENAIRNNNEYLDDYKDQIRRLKADRMDFWRATMHKYGCCCNDNDDLVDYADRIDEFTTKYGRFFKSQPAKRVSGILDALDAASQDWDKTEPHAFYVTLKDNFPDSVKQPSAPEKALTTTGARLRKNGKSDALKVAIAIILLAAYLIYLLNS